MKNTFIALCTLIWVGSLNPILAQEIPSDIGNEISIVAGLRFTQIKEDRFSGIVKKPILRKIGLIHSKWNEKRRMTLISSFSTNKVGTSTNQLKFKIINPDVNFSYQRKMNGLWIGPSLSHQTILIFPKLQGNAFTNNLISYTMSNKLGIACDKTIDVSKADKNNFYADIGFQADLLNHVIRPAYAHPYPEKFLDESVFNPLREGMTGALLKSGKVNSINKYQSFKIRFGISYYHKEHFKVGLQYTYDYQAYKQGKQLVYNTNDLNLILSYRY